MLARLSAVAVGLLLLTAATAHARPHHSHQSQSIITCDEHGCSDLASLPPQRHTETRGRAYRTGRPVVIRDVTPRSSGVITVASAAGPIHVSPAIATSMQGFIADVVARGFHGPVHCFARGGHVRNSNHYWGGACDFAQRGWNKTVAVMYHVRDLASKWGLRDGCTFRDCGHIDLPRYASRHRQTRLAQR